VTGAAARTMSPVLSITRATDAGVPGVPVPRTRAAEEALLRARGLLAPTLWWQGATWTCDDDDDDDMPEPEEDDDDEEPVPALIPVVPDRVHGNDFLIDIYSRLMRDRIVFVDGVVSDSVARRVVSSILYLAGENPQGEISLYINGSGGSVTAGLAIVDTMRSVPCPISTVILGVAPSMSSVIAAAGATGRRFALRHAWNLMHQGRYTGYVQGQATDIEIEARRMLRLEEQCNRIYADATGKPMEQIARDCERDLWLDSADMLAYGLVDRILDTLPAAGAAPGAAN
jgi:ATP-dependent Clp protease protease subunit